MTRLAVQEPSVEHGTALPERGAATRMLAEVAPPLLTAPRRERRFAQLGPEPGAPQAVLSRAPPAFGQAKSNRAPGASAFAGVRSGDRDDALLRLCRWFAEAFQTWKNRAYLKGVGYKKEPRRPSTAPHPLFGPISSLGGTLLFGRAALRC